MKKLALFSIAFIISLLISAQGNWTLQNPYPLGDDFTDVQVISDQKAILVSNEGLIIQTTDAGDSWDTLFYDSDPQYNFKKITFPDPDHGWVISGNVLIKTENGGTNWSWSPTILNDGEYNDIFYLNQYVGFVAGRLDKKATVLRTDDGGLSWSQILSDSSMWSAFSVAFVDDSVGFAGGFCKALKTFDGGSSWNEIEIPISRYSLKFIYFFDQDQGYIGFDNDTIMKTSDGGISWDVCANPGIDISSMYFKNMSDGWITGSIYGQSILKKTSDGGNSWDSCLVDNSSRFDGIDFYGDESACLVGELGTIFNTADGGVSWDKKSGTITPASMLAIDFINQQEGWISCYDPNILIKTDDGGENWTEIHDFGNDFVDDLVFVDENTGWGRSGAKLLKTMDGGNSWDSVFSLASWGIKSLAAIDADKIFVTDDTTIYRSNDGGQNWEETSLCDSCFSYGRITFYENTGWITAVVGSWWSYEAYLYRSDDGGINWYLQNSSDDYDHLYFMNQDTGFAVAFHSTWGGWMTCHIDKTTDGGMTWDVKYITGGEYWCPYFHAIDFSDDNNGWAISYGWSLQTTDGGETWLHPEEKPNSGHDLIFVDENTGWLVDDNMIWKYENGGTVIIPDEQEKHENEHLLVYPNPSSGVAQLRYSILDTQYLIFEVYSSDGVLIKSLPVGYQPAGEYNVDLDLSNLPDGIYFIRLQAGEKFETAKIIKVSSRQ